MARQLNFGGKLFLIFLLVCLLSIVRTMFLEESQAVILKGNTRYVLMDENQSYCRKMPGGILLQTVKPGETNDYHKGVVEQWVAHERLSVVSESQEAKLISLKDGLYELQLPAGASCPGREFGN